MKIHYAMAILVLLISPIAAAETTFFDDPDGFFIMGDSPTTPTTGQVTGGGGCRYEWNCTNWSECLPSGKQTRNCTNIGTCSDTYRTPEIEQNCTYTIPEMGEESKELEKEKETEEEKEKETEEKEEKGEISEKEIIDKNKQEDIEEIIEKKIVDKNKILVYSIIILMIVSIIFYLKKDYFKKLVKKIK